jgi:hypothetical protein
MVHSKRGLLTAPAEDHVWFEDRWMVASFCDEWLTTLCGLILGQVLQVQVAAWLVFVQVKNKRERSSLVRSPGVEKTSRLRPRDSVASGVKCGPHGGMNSKMKSWMVSWLSLKTKVEPGLRGSRVMSGDSQRLHRVRRVSSGSPENHYFLGWSTKPRLKNRRWSCSSSKPVWLVGTGLTGEENRSDWCATTQSGDFEAEDTRQDRKACVEAKQVCGCWASVRWWYEDNFPKWPWWVCIPV